MGQPPELKQTPVPRARNVARRRIVALLLVGAMIGAGVWAATAAIRKVGKKDTPPPPATTAVLAPPKIFRIVFPEGFTRAQMAARITAVDAIARRKRGFRPKLSALDYLAATGSSDLRGRFAGDGKRGSLEGFLFPASYDLFQTDTAKVLVAKQLATFRARWSQVKLGYARSKNLTPYDVLIIASMVEKEAVIDSERRLIAAVIYNRLRARIPLAIDATIRYALNVPGTKPLTQSELSNPTPYNTRIHLGLPPTPIGNPGLQSMEAAAHPARVNYLYFVAEPDKKHHFFTASFKAFQEYLAKHGYGPHP